MSVRSKIVAPEYRLLEQGTHGATRLLMKTLLRLLGLLVVVAALAVGAFALMVHYEPSEYRYEYSIVIDAPASTVFNLVSDLKQHEKWSPWKEMEPTAEMTYTGTTAGEGASMSWKGNNIGEGSQQIISVVEDKEVKLELAFKAPYEDVAEASWWFDDVDDGVMLTWSIWGTNNFVRKAMDQLFDFEAMFAKDFNKGLNNIKKIAEELASQDDDLVDAVMALDEEEVREVLNIDSELPEDIDTSTETPSSEQ